MKRALGPGASLALALAALSLAFVVFAWPRAWWNDDAFITFRYAANLAAGHGFVWNTAAPQHVEGTSSLAWTWACALGIRLGLEPVAVALALGCIAGAATLGVVGFGAWRVGGAAIAIALLAAVLLATQRQWLLWSISGMEMTVAGLVLLVATLRLIQEAQGVDAGSGSARRGSTWPAGGASPWRAGAGSGVLFFAASLLRPESPLLHLAAALGIVVANRRFLRLGTASGVVHGCGLAALTAWRLVYFGQPLPNTFYVKVGALQLDRGLRFLGEFVLQNHLWIWIALVALASPWLWRRSRLVFTTCTAQILVWAAWIAAIGGDQWEFRFLVPVLPILALLTALALEQIANFIGGRVPHSDAGRAAGAVTAPGRGGAALAVGSALLIASQAFTLTRPFRNFDGVFSILQLDQSARYMGLEASLLAPYLGPDVRICTGWAGVLPYTTGASHFDPWGLNDPGIARAPLDPTRVVFHQRHAVWQDVVDHDVLVCDLFNHFLFPQPFDPAHVRTVVPWVEPGVPVYSVRLSGGQNWIFTSARPQADVEAYLSRHALQLLSVHALPAGWPALGR